MSRYFSIFDVKLDRLKICEDDDYKRDAVDEEIVLGDIWSKHESYACGRVERMRGATTERTR